MKSYLGKNSVKSLSIKLLPIILWLLPMLALNFGHKFLASSELVWLKKNQLETAQQELEALTGSSGFEYQLARHAGKFSNQLVSAASAIKPNKLREFLSNRCDSIFAKPFPEYKLFTFWKKPGKKRSELFLSRTDEIVRKRAMTMVFDYLLDINKNVPIPGNVKKQREKILQSLMGMATKGEIMALSQRGRTSFILSENRPSWFIWDFKEVPNKGILGYFILTKISQSKHSAAKLLALKACQARKKGLAGFIPLVPDQGGNVLFAKLSRSRIFKNWLKTSIPQLDKNAYFWFKKGPPRVTQLGKYNAFTHLGRDKSHLSVFLAPTPILKPLPTWIWLLNLLLLSTVILLTLRGIMFNQWIEMRLTVRFIMLYFLAATLPLSLMTISGFGYLFQYTYSSQNQIASTLNACLQQYDARKAQVQDAYKSTAAQIFNDAKLSELISKEGIYHETVHARILSFFKKRTDPLPLLGIYLLDLSGQGWHYYEGTTKERLDPAFSVFKSPIINKLRENFRKKHPDIPMPDFVIPENEKFGALAFDSISTNDLSAEAEKRRGYTISRKLGVYTATQIHNFLKKDGKESVMLYIIWEDRMLDDRTLKDTTAYLGLNYPQYVFTAFKNTSQGLSPTLIPSRHVSSDFLSEAERIAESALARGGSVSGTSDKFSLLAKPARKYFNTILVGGVNHYYLEIQEMYRWGIFLLIIVVSLIILLLCAYFTSTILLKPITDMKNALERVSGGNLEIELASDRQDELGELTKDFSSMVKGMQERKKLAALLSDQAIEAISGDNSDNGGILKGKEFHGIALVSDIRSFTTLCELHQASAITAMLNDHFAAMAKIIASNGGRIYKFIGDAIEAIFPEDEDDGASERAIKAALEMNLALMEINSIREARNEFTYEFGVGLAMGTFYSGGIGSEDTRLDYAVIGEALSRAAELEALSKKTKEIPIVVDDSISKIADDMIEWEKIADESISGCALKITTDWTQRVLAEAKSQQQIDLPDPQQEVVARDTQTKSVSLFAKQFSRISLGIFVLFSILVGFGAYKGFEFHNTSLREASSQSARETMFGLVEQLKSEVSVRIGFEMKMKRLIRKIERKLSWKIKPTEKNIIANSFSAELKSMEQGGFPSSRALAVFFNPLDRDKGNPEKLAAVTVVHNLTANHEKWLKEIACHQHNRFLGISTGNLRQSFEPHLKELFGHSFNVSILATERFGAAMLVKNKDVAEYFYWNYITVYDPELTDISLEKSTRKLVGCNKEKFRIVGLVMVAVPVELVRNSPEFRVAGYESPEYDFAVVSQENKIAKTSNFPDTSPIKLTYTSKIPESPNYIYQENVIEFARKKHRLITAIKLSTTNEADMTRIFFIIFLIVLAASLYVYGSIYQSTFLTRSLGAKLWFSILLITIVPLITVLFVMDFYLTENKNAMIGQEKIEIKRYLDSFEMRQFFFKPVAAKLLNEWTMDPLIIENLKKLDKNPDSKETLAIIKKFLKEKFSSFEKPYGYCSNFNPRELILASKQGWFHTISPQKKDDKPTEFGTILGQIGKNFLYRLQKNSHSNKLNPDMVKSEMYFDSGLATVRSSFGDDEYIKFSNAIGQMVELEVTTGAAALQIQPLPSLDQPDYILIWLSMFDLGSHLTKVAENSEDKYAVFSLELHRYGILAQPGRTRGDLGLDNVSAWINGSNLPVSQERRYGEENLLIEGRPGIAQFTNYLIAIGSKNPILKEIAQLRAWFNRLLLLSVVIILFIAHRTASDIIIPIRSLSQGMKEIDHQNFLFRIKLDRKDELGELCNSYDHLAKGLAEKALMGKMVSQSALKSSSEGILNAEAVSGEKTEYAFLFIGIPGFASWLGTGTVGELFLDLQKQTAEICKIIIEEGGDIDKFIGDKLLGVFPTTADRPQDGANAALKAARRILKAEELGNLPFPVALGVNHGEVISGFLGVGDKRDFTVIGDAVNISARIEKEAEKVRFRRCLFSENFIETVAQKTSFRFYSEVILKGKTSHLKLFEHI